MGTSFWRPVVCLECAKASRVIRPFGQNIALALLGPALLMAVFKFAPASYQYLWFIAAVGIVWAFDALLLVQTARLKPLLPKNSTHAA